MLPPHLSQQFLESLTSSLWCHNALSIHVYSGEVPRVAVQVNNHAGTLGQDLLGCCMLQLLMPSHHRLPLALRPDGTSLSVAWDVQGLSQLQQARLEDSLKLLGTLRPFRGSLYAVILSGLSEEKSLRVERLGKVSEAMKADERTAPSAWDLGPWCQLLGLYGR